jgi:hypothetical protein
MRFRSTHGVILSEEALGGRPRAAHPAQRPTASGLAPLAAHVAGEAVRRERYAANLA